MWGPREISLVDRPSQWANCAFYIAQFVMSCLSAKLHDFKYTSTALPPMSGCDTRDYF